ncbi:MAG: hypothetical protein HY917_01965 [Candidatus Diapherotrites archaeon]|nr:hypothetical protein [Candidatus Diapherotrites archaeon]
MRKNQLLGIGVLAGLFLFWVPFPFIDSRLIGTLLLLAIGLYLLLVS